MGAWESKNVNTYTPIPHKGRFSCNDSSESPSPGAARPQEKSTLESVPLLPYFHTLFLPLILSLLLSLPLPGGAHTYSTSYSYLTIEEDRVTYQLKVPASQFLLAIHTEAEKLDENLDKAVRYLQDKIKILSGGSPCNLELQQIHPLDEDPIFMFIDMEFKCKKPIRNFVMSCSILEDVPELYHQNLARITFEGETRRFLFTTDRPRYYDWEAGGASAEIPRQKPFIRIHEKTWSGIQQGIIGWGLPLFLLALLLPVGISTEAFKIMVAFTLAHSLTFLLSVFLPLSLAPRFVSATATLCVIYMALENLSVKTTPNRWTLAGVFGLVYGLHFAEIGNLRPETGLPSPVSSLFAFYVGLEIGQLLILLFLVPALYYLNQWRWSYRTIQAFSVAILVLSLFQFIRQVFY